MRIFCLIVSVLLGWGSGIARSSEPPETVGEGTAITQPTSAVAAVVSTDDAMDEGPTAWDVFAGALDLQRGVKSSYSEATMIVHRPDWERTSRFVAWTRGREDALIRFVAPAKDAGNANLKQGAKMWTFTPKLNRSIRLPYSLMSQSWAGSDFSYNDLSRTDELLHQYDLEIVERREDGGHTIYVIDAVPHEEAPVVWGKEQVVIRDDYVLLEQTFIDQDFEPLKRMETLEIRELGGRTFGTRMRMVKLEEPENYTEIQYHKAEFDIDLDDRLFTLFSLQSGARP